MKNLLSAIAVAAISFSGWETCATTIYDEAVSGDLVGLPNDINPPPFTLLQFDIGANTIKGTATLYSMDPSPLNDRDPFTFIVPAGLHVNGYSITWQNTHFNPVTHFLNASWVVFEGDCIPSCGPLVGHLSIDLANGDGAHSLNTPPLMRLEPSTYTAVHSLATDLAGARSTNLVTYSYELTFFVFEGPLPELPPPPPPPLLPEPGTLAVFGAGLFALGYTRRKR